MTDAITTALAPVWQPIADIPDEVRDEGCVLLYKPDEPRSGPEMIVAYWGEWPGVGGYCWIRAGGQPIAWVSMWTGEPVPQGVVTHWMQLPEPPQ